MNNVKLKALKPKTQLFYVNPVDLVVHSLLWGRLVNDKELGNLAILYSINNKFGYEMVKLAETHFDFLFDTYKEADQLVELTMLLASQDRQPDYETEEDNINPQHLK